MFDKLWKNVLKYSDDCAVIYYIIVFLTDFPLYFSKWSLGKIQVCYLC